MNGTRLSGQSEIAVIGAGIGGLAAALSLQRAGFRVHVYEQAPILAEVGAGLSLSPTAAHGLAFLGLRDALLARAWTPEDQFIRHWQDGRLLMTVNRGRFLQERYGERYYLIHRADLHDMLAAAVRANDADSVSLGRRFATLRQSGGRVEVGFTDGSTVSADAVIGADGSRSAVRDAVFGGRRPTFTGYVAWRGLAPAEHTRGILADPPSGVFIGPGHMVNRYPVRGGRLVNVVAFAERNEWTAEGWSIPATVQELLDEFAGWHPDIRHMLASIPPEALFKWGLFARETLEDWVSGHVALLGDAAHPILPFLGHGAVLAIEDGVVLGRAFAGSSTIAEALARYAAARRERAAFVVAESTKAVRLFHGDRPQNYATAAGNRAADEGLGLFGYNPATAPV